MATATASTTSAPAAASSAQGTDDNYAATGLGVEPAPAEVPATGEGADSATAAPAEVTSSSADDNRASDPLRAERRRTNQLEKEIRTLKPG
jgi:hypothetical protein